MKPHPRAGGVSELDSAACQGAILDSLAHAQGFASPYPHWLLSDFLPPAAMAQLADLPFPVPDLAGVSGTREIHNATRRFIDPETRSQFPACEAVAQALQAPGTAARIMALTGAELARCWLRIEFAQDADGFWLAPHTDVGAKRFSLVCGLEAAGRQDLGTDIYRAPDSWVKRAPFGPGLALAFVPSDKTWHGFAPRRIRGIRKSLLVNYVSSEWRAREQLAFPLRPVAPARD